MSDISVPNHYSGRHLAFFVPLLLIHLACLGVVYTGVSGVAVLVFVITVFIRIFGITAGFHRLLSHKSYNTTRTFQFIVALMGTLAGQNGPLWWVGHHRLHHKHSDTLLDSHSPKKGFFWSHMGWLFSPEYMEIRREVVPDLLRLPEMVFLEKYYYPIHVLFLVLLFVTGEIISIAFPQSGTSGLQLLIWGGILSTVCVFHMVWSANSVCHKYGAHPYDTGDDSRNNFWIALITMGDGWHNNHHYFPRSVRHGLHWWQLDFNYWILRGLEKLGLVWDMHLANPGAKPEPPL